jgi:hypothetical protein
MLIVRLIIPVRHQRLKRSGAYALLSFLDRPLKIRVDEPI